MHKKAFLVFTLVVMALSFSLVAAQDGPVRVAVVLPSSTTDLAWSQSMYDSLVAVQAEMGGEGAMEIAVSENTWDVTKAAEAIRDYAENGYNLVIAHGAQYGETLKELAPDYPETSFAWGTASETYSGDGIMNIFAYEARAETGGYVNGIMAGLLTKSNKIGIIGPIPAGDAILYNNGFIQGVKTSNPEAEVLVAYTGSFGDTAAATEIAQTQIAAGADILTGSAQQVPGAISATQEAGLKWFSTDTDQSVQWPDTVVASQTFDWTGPLKDMLANRANGVLGDKAYELSLENGGIRIVFSNVEIPAEVRAAGEQAIADLESGRVYALKNLPEQGTVFRVAIVMPSSITDLAWSQSIFTGLQKVQKQLGGESVMEIAYTEGMFDVTAAAQALRDYAEDGYNLVIAHGTQYGTSLFELAPDYPDTAFAWGTATDTGAEQGITNVFAYEARAEEGGYVNGVMAGLMSKSNTIGIVGPVPAGDALLYINGFRQGVVASNPEANVLVAYTGSFGDTAAAAETARTQISAGADVLTGSAQQVVGAIEAIQAANGYWFGTQSDQSGQWPETVVASQVFNWAPVIGQMIDLSLSGIKGGRAYELSLANGGLEIVYGGVDVPQEVKDAAAAAAEKVKSGEVVVQRELPE